MLPLHTELGVQHTIGALADGLERDERIVYTENGNRAVKGTVLLRRLERLASRFGVSRVANISYLSYANYPVFQACRPAIFSHAEFGQNTGSQGKGPSAVQAKISCLMEAMEVYCAEPRNAMLVRGSYDFLKDQHLVADPRTFVEIASVPRVAPDEPLMWSQALSLGTRESLLIPAETIYAPFFADVFETRPRYPVSSNGLASGSSYLEATLHAIYELAERMVRAAFERGEARIEALFDDEIKLPGFQEFLARLGEEYQVQVYVIELPRRPNIPVVLCLLVGAELVCEGWGASLTVDISISRAVSEALQCVSTRISGTREDFSVHQHGDDERPFFKHGQPEHPTLHVDAYRKRVIDRRFRSLREELDAVVRWVRGAGYADIYAANLTRHGIDLPVVKVVVPGMEMPDALKEPPRPRRDKGPLTAQYPTIRGLGT